MMPAIPPAASHRPIYLGAVPRWYLLGTKESTGFIFDWCDINTTDYTPCRVRVLRNWPVLTRDGRIIIAPTIIEYFKGGTL